VERLSADELAVAIRDLTEWAQTQTPAEDPPLRRRIAEHLGCDPAELPVVSRTFSPWERANLQVALDAYLGQDGRSHEFVGLSAQRGWHMGLAELAQRPERGGRGFVTTFGAGAGPQEHLTVQIGERTIVCVAAGLFLIADGDKRLVVAVQGAESHGPEPGIELQAMTIARDTAEGFLAEIGRLTGVHNVYRGRVLEVGATPFGGISLEVRELPRVVRERIVLPDGLLDKIERHTLRFAEQAQRLRDAGQHVKRGLLLHGPPGTGKTLTAMYLAGQMPDRTVLILSGQGLGAIGAACSVARELTPSMVILEDVDLIALERDAYSSSALLFELLNEMDGLKADLDVVFLLTTNRADRLEPALAARPGRVDLAAELPLPDAEGRLRLLDLYSEGLTVQAADLPAIVARTEGASPAFIREFPRRAALLASERSTGKLIIDESILAAALAELTSDGGSLTKRLLGMQEPPPPIDHQETA
jgi:hypothetical protein